MDDSKSRTGWRDVTQPPPKPKKTDPFDEKTVQRIQQAARARGYGNLSAHELAELAARWEVVKKAKRREAKRRKRRWGVGGSALVGGYSKRSSGQKFGR